MEEEKRLLLNPAGVVDIPRLKVHPHSESLENKTILLRWNGKHNGDVFLERIVGLLRESVPGIKLIKSWEVLPETANSSRSSLKSQEWGRKMADLKPDLVIAAQAD